MIRVEKPKIESNVEWLNWSRIKPLSVNFNLQIEKEYSKQSSFDEYKADNPDINLTVSDYTGYFETGEAIEKIMIVENVRLLRQFPTLDEAKMTLPYDNKTYSIEINRESVNEYLGFRVEELKTEDDSWNTKFLDPIGYDNSKRKAFFDKFGNIE
ncbi:hypothetical protein ACTHO0_25925 [Cytobacillus praedii]|uniref:hypothetical protein n=1 Tax=Cytobacillus praedii TaxID=1742358 RepID=UPI003F80601C